MADLSLYIHIPFCVRKCRYCDFLSAPADETVRKDYVLALVNEIKSYGFETYGREIGTVFFGGGTPSLLDVADVSAIFEALCEVFTISEDAEITMECNPGTISREKLLCYRELGINRLSIGLQSTIESELKLLGRIHSFEDFTENYRLARELGFSNINVDLMSGLPGQTVSDWEESLRKAAKLSPEHISAYSLIIEEGTPFFAQYADHGCVDGLNIPDEETDRRMYRLTRQILSEYGFSRYEISNYAKPGRESRHNMVYWTGGEYLGLGLGASSFYKGRRYKNNPELRDYIDYNMSYLGSVVRERYEEEEVDKKAAMEDFMIFGLRLMKGVSKQEFASRFGQSFESVFGEVTRKFVSMKLLADEGGRVFLTEDGIDVSNIIMEEFLFD